MDSNITKIRKPVIKRPDLVEPELSYKVVGVLFKVFNELGPGLYEKNYQKAVAVGLFENKIKFKQEFPIPLNFSGRNVGKYFIDFMVEDKILLELKSGSRINRKHAQQLLTYLRATKLKLGILVYFGSDTVFFKRIINLIS